MRVLLFLASALTACAFVQPAPHASQPSRFASERLQASEASEIGETPGFALALGASVGYAAAMAARGSAMMRRAESQPPAAVARTPVAYPIFTFRWGADGQTMSNTLKNMRYLLLRSFEIF